MEIFPLLVNVTDCEVDDFTACVPKSIEAGEAVRPVAAFSPEPERGTVIGVLSSAAEMTSEPVDGLPFTGEKTTVRLTALPGARLTAAGEDESAKPDPETRSC